MSQDPTGFGRDSTPNGVTPAMLKQSRLIQLLDELIGQCEHFQSEACAADRFCHFPFISPQDARAAAAYSYELGLTVDARQLWIDYQNLFNGFMDCWLCEATRSQSPEWQDFLEEKCGAYPRPVADQGEHNRLQKERLWPIIGGMVGLAKRMRAINEILRSHASNARSADATPHTSQSEKASRGSEPRGRRLLEVEASDKITQRESLREKFEYFKAHYKKLGYSKGSIEFFWQWSESNDSAELHVDTPGQIRAELKAHREYLARRDKKP